VLRAKHLTVLLVPVFVAGCGGSSSPSRPAAPSVRETSVGRGTHQVWLFEPSTRKPKAMVVFVHGRGDAREDTPYYHRPWLRHLAAPGNAVL
jgi:acetyl esterase/lipase